MLSRSRRVPAVCSAQESNIHTIGTLGQEAEVSECTDWKSQSTEITTSLFRDLISVFGSDLDLQQMEISASPLKSHYCAR